MGLNVHLTAFPLLSSTKQQRETTKFCVFLEKVNYSRTPVTRTLKGNEKQFELAGFRVFGVD